MARLLDVQGRLQSGDNHPAREYITAELARAVLVREQREQKLKTPNGSFREDDRYNQFKAQQQAVATELQRAKAARVDQQFPVLIETAEQALEQAKMFVLNTERGLAEEQQRQAAQKETRLRGLLQMLPKS